MSVYEKALLDPTSAFTAPEQVLTSAELSREQKMEILHRWEYDAPGPLHRQGKLASAVRRIKAGRADLSNGTAHDQLSLAPGDVSGRRGRPIPWRLVEPVEDSLVGVGSRRVKGIHCALQGGWARTWSFADRQAARTGAGCRSGVGEGARFGIHDPRHGYTMSALLQ